MMRKLGAVTLALALAACGPPEQTGETGPSLESPFQDIPVAMTPLQRQGRVIYETMCWTCHGPAGRGDGPAVEAGSIPPPPSFLGEEYAGSSSEGLERRFQAGVSGVDTSHPHMRYVTSLLRPESFTAAISYIPVLAYPPEIPGSAVAGESLYQGRCVGCHGPAGRGDGTAAASLMLMSPADFTSDTLIAARDWDGILGRIREGGRQVHGSSMPPWGVVLNEGQMWDLVAYLATFQPGVLDAPPWAN
jgi:mono/diheme cytochrome c family protein